MKVSVCVTIFNEEKSIARLLDSLLVQSQKPDEIVIVDGGSTDKTLEIIRHYQKKDNRIKVVVEAGSVAHGRNTAIEFSQNQIIAQIDAGCIAKKDWLERITEPFAHEKVSVVAGFYEMKAVTPLQKAQNVYHGIPPERFDHLGFIPSARSVAFRKKVWEEVGGYNEKLEKAGEDTHFFYKLVKEGVKIVRVKEARVIWEESGNLTFMDSFKKFYNYAKGDAQAGIWWHPSKQFSSHNIKISAIFLRYFIGLILLILASFGYFSYLYLYIIISLYLFYPIWKWKDVIKDSKARVWLPIIQILSDFSVMAGFIVGTIIKK